MGQDKEKLREVARRVVWFKSPDETLADEDHFIAHVLCYGSFKDVQIVRRALGDQRIRQALEVAPSGIFSPRQWSFWNTFYDRLPVPPMPVRRLPSRVL